MLAYIPSPSSNGISLGPLHLRAYGLLIALGVFAAVWLADRRWQARGGAPGTMTSVAVWGVPGGLIGARLYHIATDYQNYTHHLLDVFKIWKGGLGIWGGVAGGVLAAGIYIRRHHLDFGALLDCAAPALPLAQAIGRVGNYFNQELYGRPTKLPWALRIDNPAPYPSGTTFHPTFLYEALWDLAVVGLLLWAEKRFRLRKGYLFVLYIALYTFGRFFTEYLRIDEAHKIAGLRFNDWTSIVIFVAAATLLVRRGRPDPEPAAPVDPGTPGGATAVPAERDETGPPR